MLLITDKFEVNITELVQEKLGNSIYTTILAQYAGFPEQLLQWYVNGKPVGSGNTMFHVNYDGLNTYLRFKHDVNETFGTFMLKVNGTNWKDTLNLPNAKKFFASSKSFFSKIVTKVVNGNTLYDLKDIPDSKSDKPTNRKYRPERVLQGQDRRQQTMPRSPHDSPNSFFSSKRNLPLSKNKSNRKFLPEVIRLGQDKKQRTNTPSHLVNRDSILSSESNLPLDTSSIQDGTFSSVIPSALSEL